MKMKTQGLFIAFAFMIVMLAGLTSASTVFELENITVIPSEINHGESIDVELNISYTGDASGDVNLAWEGFNPSDTDFWTIPSLKKISSDGDGTTVESALTTFKFSIPEHYSAGQIDASLKMDGTGSPDYFNFSITVPEDDSLTITGADFASGENSTTITVKNDGNTLLSGIGLTSSGDFDVTFNTTGFDLSAGEEKSVLVEIVNTNSLSIGSNSVTITAEAADGTKATKNLSYVKELYEGENEGDLNLGTIDFNTKEGFGEDEDFWYPLDVVEIEFDVENNGNWDVQDIEIEVCLYDETDGKCIMDEADMDLSDDSFDLDSGDDTTITITLNVDPDELKEGNTDYTLYISAVGEIDDNDADDLDGDQTGVSDSKSIKIVTDDEFMVVSSFLIDGEEIKMDGFYEKLLSCGDKLQVEFTVYNIGDEDLEDHYVEIYNKDLKLYEKINLEDIDAFDKQTLLYEIVIPEDAKGGQYSISFEVFDDDNDILENNEEDEARTYLYFKVEDSCLVSAPTVISTTIDSEKVVEGENLEITTKIRNDDLEDRSFTVQVEGYNSWADLVELNPESFDLQSGRIQDLKIKFDLLEESKGEQSFSLKVYSEDGQLVLTQPFTVNVEEDTSFDLSKVFDDFDWTVALIIAVNIILLIAIIVVAVKIIRKG